MHDSYLIYDIFIMLCFLVLCASRLCAHADGFGMTGEGQKEGYHQDPDD